jgi:hypothetical protein
LLVPLHVQEEEEEQEEQEEEVPMESVQTLLLCCGGLDRSCSRSFCAKYPFLNMLSSVIDENDVRYLKAMMHTKGYKELTPRSEFACSFEVEHHSNNLLVPGKKRKKSWSSKVCKGWVRRANL